MWLHAQHFPWHSFPNCYAEWLQNAGSLTQRFRELSKGALQHELFFEGWKELDPSELEILNSLSTTAWVREIVFYGQQQPWEWARTIIPPSSLHDEGEAFLHLGNKPIGDILFSDPNLKRSSFEIAQLDLNHPYTQEINSLLNLQASTIWARRSVIYFYQKPLLIYECFLPAVMEAISAT